MSGTPRPRKSLTVGSLLDSGQGVNVHCKCGHRTALLPAQLAAMAHPQMRLLELKRRFRCTMCGRSGMGDDLSLATFDVAAPFIDDGGAFVRTTRRPHH
jgi:hypothetical protein